MSPKHEVLAPADSLRASIDRQISKCTANQIAVILLALCAIVALLLLLTPVLHALRFVTTFAVVVLISLGISSIALLLQTTVAPGNANKLIVVAGGTLTLGVLAWALSPQSATAHPLFKTPLSGENAARPAIQVDILNDSEVFGTAELYLSVQSSRFPADVRLIFPLNRGDFQGCTARFIHLPFEVANDDVLLLNLLDDDGLSESDERLVLSASRTAGFCLVIGGVVVEPELEPLISPAFMNTADVIGNKIVLHYRQNPFQNMGAGEYIVEASRPKAPNRANRVSLLDKNRYARAQVRIYFPEMELMALDDSTKAM